MSEETNELKEGTIEYDGKTYSTGIMSTESKYLIQQLADVENKMRKLIFEKEQLRAAQNYFKDSLKDSLERDASADEAVA